MKSKESGFARYLDSSLRKDSLAGRLLMAEIMKAPVSSQLRVLRRFRGLTQVALSRKARLLQPEIVRLERAGSNPRATTLERIAAGLGARLGLIPKEMIPLVERAWAARWAA